MLPSASIHQNTRSAAHIPASQDIMTVLPVLACLFAILLSPWLLFINHVPQAQHGTFEVAVENKIFWPIMAAASVMLTIRNIGRGVTASWPPSIICLAVFLCFAGASTLWSFSPEHTLKRFLQQIMVVMSVVLPALYATRWPNIMHRLFLCFALATFVNLYFVQTYGMHGYGNLAEGQPGYFTSKNYLGQFAALAFLISLYELRYRGARRLFAILLVVISYTLIILSNSKTSIGLALLSPCLAAGFLVAHRYLRIPPGYMVLSLVIAFVAFAAITGFSFGKLSYRLYGDSTFTGRQLIWDFLSYKFSQRPLLGWGYQSFWLVGPSGPSVTDAPGWVKSMPSGHSGYYDVAVELGYVGLLLLYSLIILTLNSIGRVADRDPVRGLLLLSVAIFIILYNGLESLWFRGFEFMWVMFLIVIAEAARFSKPTRHTGGRRMPARGQVSVAGG